MAAAAPGTAVILKILKMLKILKILEILKILKYLEILKILKMLKYLKYLKILKYIEILKILKYIEILKMEGAGPGRLQQGRSREIWIFKFAGELGAWSCEL